MLFYVIGDRLEGFKLVNDIMLCIFLKNIFILKRRRKYRVVRIDERRLFGSYCSSLRKRGGSVWR